MTGFINYLPSPVVAHLWDWMLLDKDLSVLFRMTLGIISLKEVIIAKAHSAGELVNCIMELKLSQCDVEMHELVSCVYHNVKRVPLVALQNRREESYSQQKEEFEECQTKKEMVLLSRTTHCMFILNHE